MTKGSYSRKIQKTGGSTFILSLPIEWIRKAKLDKGDIIEIYPQPEGNLLLQPFSDRRNKIRGETELDIREYTESSTILRLILSKYLAGYQMIKIYHPNGIDFEIRTLVTQFVSNLKGVEIVEESEYWIVLKDLLSLESLDLKELIKRTHVKADQMFSTSIDSMINHDKEKAKQVILNEPDVDRFYYLISRQLNAVLSDFSYSSYLGLDLIEVLDYNLVTKRLEAIADHAHGVAQMVLEMEEGITDDKIRNSIETLANNVRERYKKGINCFFNDKIIEANEIADEKVDYRDQVRSLYPSIINLDTEQAIRIILILRSFERISSYAADIAEVVINRAR